MQSMQIQMWLSVCLVPTLWMTGFYLDSVLEHKPDFYQHSALDICMTIEHDKWACISTAV